MFYLLQGNDCHLLLQMAHGQGATEAKLHLPRYLHLRARLRSSFPDVALVPDSTLLALLTFLYRLGWRHITDTVKDIAAEFSFVRLMEGHPERGEGQPTEAELKAAGSRCRDRGPSPPADLAADAGHADDGNGLERRMGWGWLDLRGLHPWTSAASKRLVEAAESFHRSST